MHPLILMLMTGLWQSPSDAKLVAYGWVDEHQEEIRTVNQEIWRHPELALREYRSSQTLISFLRGHGFQIEQASTSPHLGRSALDAVELMNVGVNFIREHVKPDARIHYVISNGGGQPNVVPAEAEVWYYIRANKHADVLAMYEWIPGPAGR